MTCVNVLLFSLSTDSFALTHIFAGFCARFHSHRMSNEINGKSFVSFAFFSASFFFSDVNGTTNKFTFYVSNEEGRRKERSISNEQGRETGREREREEGLLCYLLDFQQHHHFSCYPYCMIWWKTANSALIESFRFDAEKLQPKLKIWNFLLFYVLFSAWQKGFFVSFSVNSN